MKNIFNSLFKNNFYRKVAISLFILFIIWIFIADKYNLSSKIFGFGLGLIWLLPYEFLFFKDFEDYIKERNK